MLKYYIWLLVSGSSERDAVGDAERHHVRPQRVGHPGH